MTEVKEFLRNGSEKKVRDVLDDNGDVRPITDFQGVGGQIIDLPEREVDTSLADARADAQAQYEAASQAYDRLLDEEYDKNNGRITYEVAASNLERKNIFPPVEPEHLRPSEHPVNHAGLFRAATIEDK